MMISAFIRFGASLRPWSLRGLPQKLEELKESLRLTTAGNARTAPGFGRMNLRNNLEFTGGVSLPAELLIHPCQRVVSLDVSGLQLDDPLEFCLCAGEIPLLLQHSRQPVVRLHGLRPQPDPLSEKALRLGEVVP